MKKIKSFPKIDKSIKKKLIIAIATISSVLLSYFIAMKYIESYASSDALRSYDPNQYRSVETTKYARLNEKEKISVFNYAMAAFDIPSGLVRSTAYSLAYFVGSGTGGDWSVENLNFYKAVDAVGPGKSDKLAAIGKNNWGPFKKWATNHPGSYNLVMNSMIDLPVGGIVGIGTGKVFNKSLSLTALEKSKIVIKLESLLWDKATLKYAKSALRECAGLAYSPSGGSVIAKNNFHFVSVANAADSTCIEFAQEGWKHLHDFVLLKKGNINIPSTEEAIDRIYRNSIEVLRRKGQTIQKVSKPGSVSNKKYLADAAKKIYEYGTHVRYFRDSGDEVHVVFENKSGDFEFPVQILTRKNGAKGFTVRTLRRPGTTEVSNVKTHVSIKNKAELEIVYKKIVPFLIDNNINNFKIVPHNQAAAKRAGKTVAGVGQGEKALTIYTKNAEDSVFISKILDEYITKIGFQDSIPRYNYMGKLAGPSNRVQLVRDYFNIKLLDDGKNMPVISIDKVVWDRLRQQGHSVASLNKYFGKKGAAFGETAGNNLFLRIDQSFDSYTYGKLKGTYDPYKRILSSKDAYISERSRNILYKLYDSADRISFDPARLALVEKLGEQGTLNAVGISSFGMR